MELQKMFKINISDVSYVMSVTWESSCCTTVELTKTQNSPQNVLNHSRGKLCGKRARPATSQIWCCSSVKIKILEWVKCIKITHLKKWESLPNVAPEWPLCCRVLSENVITSPFLTKHHPDVIMSQRKQKKDFTVCQEGLTEKKE